MLETTAALGVKFMGNRSHLLLATALCFWCASPAAAEVAAVSDAAVAADAGEAVLESSESTDPAPGADWEVAFTPYLWIAGTKGDVGVPRGEGVEIDKSFADTLGNLKFAFMGALDIRHGRFVALSDVMFISVGAKAEGIRNPGFVEGKIDSSVFVGTGALGYRIVDKGPLFVDLFAGARVVSLDVEVELEGPLETRKRDASSSKVSALVGGRVRVPLGERWGLALYTDIGSGDVKWQAIGTVQYDLSRHWRVAGGYRYLKIKHSEDDLDFDVALSGPILGVTYRF